MHISYLKVTQNAFQIPQAKVQDRGGKSNKSHVHKIKAIKSKQQKHKEYKP